MKKTAIALTFIVIVLLAFTVVAAYYVSVNHSSKEEKTTPTATTLKPSTTPTTTPTQTSSISPTPSPSHAPTPSIPASLAGYYLLYGTNLTVDNNLAEQAGNVSEIFLVSANASYGNYPYPTVIFPPTSNGKILAEAGEPCVIIDATIRSDYSTQNPPPNPSSASSASAYVFLTAKIFSGQNQINATDITPQVGFANVGAFASLNSGESATLTMYLATNSTNITSFQIITRIISGIPPP